MSASPHRPAQHPKARTAGAIVTPAADVSARLSAIGRLAMTPAGAASRTAFEHACALVCGSLSAEEAYVVRAGDPHFVRIDDAGDPTAYEIKQKGYFIIWRELANNATLVGGLFNITDRLITDASELESGVAATHLALLLPGDESLSELLIVRGPWPAGLTADQVQFVTAIRPMLAYLVGTLLDTHRRERQRGQLQSLSSVASALTGSQDLQDALPAIATAMAKASGFDWVTLTLINESLDSVTARVVNQARHSQTETAAISLEGTVARERALSNARYITATKRPLLYPVIAMAEHEQPISAEMQRFFERAHIQSTATFALRTGERLIGTVNISSSAPHSFESAEVEFLTLLCEQAVMAIEWLKLHHELRDANAALARAATHDALTGLPNRVLFLDRLDQALGRAQRTGDPVAVLFVDLDDFKVVNDSLGHEVGDRLLQIVAERLQRNLRMGDTAARLGGDEFTVVLSMVAHEVEAAEVAERLRSAMQQPVEVAGHLLVPNASIGVACARAGNISSESLLRQADLAMYQAKSRGKARSACYREGMNTAAVERHTLETELRQALAAGQLRLHYQPILCLASGRMVEVEALVRWQHPERGLLPPAVFIPLAEETGLIVPLGHWVLREACRQASRWRAEQPETPLVMSVNLSARQFQHLTLVEDVAAVLAETGLPPCRLKLEITESAVMVDAGHAVETLLQLKQMGVLLAIDDFGTGYSSLSYLKRFPVDTLKVDRSFVDGLASDPNDAAIVRSIVALAKSLNLAVTAEGIETREQLALLSELGCDQGQGYLFARPLPAADLTADLIRRAEESAARAA
ncbi:MAG: putative bifunctional diguanylate cyclase/phosphodiesterase [Dehalococcoidia bacterium]